MGRPLKKTLIGNTAQSGQQIAINAWVSGDSQARAGYIIEEKNYHRYYVNTTNATSNTSFIGVVGLQNTAPTAAGQATIQITPFGAIGSGVAATANVGLYSAGNIAVYGTGSTSANYVPGEVLQLLGGSNTTISNVTVNSVHVRIANVQTNGNGFTVGDTFTFSGPGYAVPAQITVATTTGNGQIGTMSVALATDGSYTSTVLPANPVTPNVAVTANTVATTATFNLGWGVDQLTVKSPGLFSSVPANPIALSGSATGTGATINGTWTVKTVTVSPGGSGYDAPPLVSFNASLGSAAQATATIASGVVNAVTVNAGGIYAAVPGVNFVNSSNVKYAAKLNDRTVVAYDGSSYTWYASGTTLTAPGQATIPTS